MRVIVDANIESILTDELLALRRQIEKTKHL